MSVTIQQLEAFLWVAHLRGFRRASEKLHTTQPAISARIAKLEDTLGVELFEREVGGARLTSKGQELLPYAEKALQITETIRRKAGDPSSLTGVLRLGVSETIVHTILPHFLSDLHEIYPGVDVEIQVDISVNLQRELLTYAIDLALLMGPVVDHGIENLELATFDICWVASKTLELSKNETPSIEDIAKWPIATYSRNTKPYTEIYKHLSENVDQFVRIFPSSSLAACLRMASDGVGVAAVPAILTRRVLESHDLEVISSDWTPSPLRFTASYRSAPLNFVAEKAAHLASDVGRKLASSRDYPIREPLL